MKHKLSPARLRCLKAVLLAVIIIAVFSPVVSFQFLDYDDNNFIVNNPSIQDGFSVNSLKWAFTAGLTQDTTGVDYWQPVTVLSRLLDVQFYGMNPLGHHVTNLLLHVMNAFLVWFLFLKLTNHDAAAYLTALIFAIHPLQVEPVAWVTARKDLLSVFFGLWSVIFYLRYVKCRGQFGNYAASFLMFLMGVLSKPSIGIIFLIFLLIDIWPLRRMSAGFVQVIKCILEKLPFGVVFAAVMLAPMKSIPVSMSYYPKIIMMQIGAFHYFRYLGKILFPSKLSPYPSVFTYTYAGWIYVAAILVLIVLCLILFRKLKSEKPEIAFGWFWFCFLLIPFAPVNTPADRFTYLPLVGIIWMIISALSGFALRNRFDHHLIKIGLLCILVIFGVTSYRQVMIWRDTITLFEHSLANDPNNQLIQNDYGVFLMTQGKSEEALKHFLKTQQLKQQRKESSEFYKDRIFIT